MSPYSKYSLARLKVQRKVQAGLASRERRNEGRGRLAAELVRDWTPEQRQRIRGVAESELDMPELVKLIDQINEEESRR